MQMEGFKMAMLSAIPDSLLENDKEKDGKVTISAVGKLEWLRSQIIGQNVEFNTPFGKRLLTYADHTASGRSLQFIENFIMERVLPVYGNTHTEDSFVGSTTGNIVQEAQKYVKACLGGTKDDALLFCGSGSTAAIKKLQDVMGITVPSILREHVIASLKTEQRWVVFVGPMEHHSNLLSWRQSLAEVVEIPLNEKGLVDMLSLKAALENPKYKCRPKLGSFSAGSNVTGILSATRKIARLLHAHRAFACFDFAACAPYVKIDMRSGSKDGYDAVFISPHKFMGGPGTPGLLLMNKGLYLLKSEAPSSCGGGTVDFVNYDEQNTLYYDDIEHREDAGTPPIVQKIRTALVFYVKEFLTTELIDSRESFFIEKAITRLGANPNIEIYGPMTVKRTAILSFNVHQRKSFPGKDDSEIEFGSSPGSSIKSSHDSGSSADLPELQWTSRVSSTQVANRISKKCKNVFALKTFKQSLFGSVASSLRSTYEEAKSPEQETHYVRTTRKDNAKPLSCRFVVKLLNDLFGIQARGGCSCAAPYGHSLLGVNTNLSLALRGGIRKGYNSVKPGSARISFGYYITQEEFDFILSAIEIIAEFGARFLQLYALNWKTGDWTFKLRNIGEIQDMIADAEKHVFGEQKQLIWSKVTLEVPGTALLNGSTDFNVPSLTTAERRSSVMSKYLKLARYLAERLPPYCTAATQIPLGVDPAWITFMLP